MKEYTRHCRTCKQYLPYSEFPLKPSNKRARVCQECQKTHQSGQTVSQRELARKHVRGVKATTPCADCGRRYHYCVMDFDHREGETKLFNLSSAWVRGGLSKIKEEIAKCDVVCANCHRLRTYRRAGHSNDNKPIKGPTRRKLRLEQVEQIFKLHATGQYTLTQIAAWYGVDRTAISQLLAGKTHKKYFAKKNGSSDGGKNKIEAGPFY